METVENLKNLNPPPHFKHKKLIDFLKIYCKGLTTKILDLKIEDCSIGKKM
jgi:hypothetical protein